MQTPSPIARMLRSKAQAPQLPVHNVFRPRVIDLVAEAARSPFVVITGAPGTGKTVAIQQWLVRGHPSAARVAWLSLDSTDDNPARFWSYVLAALSGAGAGELDDTSALLAEGEHDDEIIVISLLNEISEHDLDRSVYLVLDDLHHLTDPVLIRQLELLVDRAPPSLHVIGSSRLDPPLPIARWRAAGRLREVRQDQLSFTSHEARELFDEYASGFDTTEVDDVTERTEGWVAALQLVALRARAEPGRALLDSIAHETSPIAAYLITEVLDQLPVDLREFLVDTSILDVFDARLCDAVTGRGDSRAFIDQLRARNLFVIALQGRRYRYHQLFADLVRVQLKEEDPTGERERALHLRAGAWLAAQGEIVNALPHLLAGGDVDAAFALAVAPGMDLWDRDEDHVESGRALDLFPREYLEREPSRIVPYAVALGAAGRWQGILPLVELAERQLEVAADSSTSADLDAVRIACHVANGDAVRALSERPTPPSSEATSGSGADGRLRVRADANLARAHLLVDDPDAATTALAAMSPHDPVTDHLVVPALRARVAAWRGELESALGLVDGVLAASQTLSAREHFAVLDAQLAAASVHVDRADLTAADDTLERSLAMAESRKVTGYQAMVLMLQAAVATMRGNLEDALSLLATARRTLRAAGVTGGLTEQVDGAKAHVQLRLGERARAHELAQDVTGERGVLLQARIAIAEDDRRRARELVADRSWSNIGNRLEALLMCATIADEDMTVRRVVDEVVELAADEMLVRPLLDVTPHLRARLLQAAERSSRPDAWDLAVALRAGVTHAEAPTIVPEPLSGRERDVLRLLKRPLTNEEIARELFVSTNTVRTHVRGIYRKLGVNSRADALARARAFHLF